MFHAIQEKDKNQYKLYVDHTEFMERNFPFLVHHAFLIGKFLSLLDLYLVLGDGCFPLSSQILKRTGRISIQKLGFNMRNFKPDLKATFRRGGMSPRPPITEPELWFWAAFRSEVGTRAEMVNRGRCFLIGLRWAWQTFQTPLVICDLTPVTKTFSWILWFDATMEATTFYFILMTMWSHHFFSYWS